MSNIVKKCGAILMGLALTATGLWAAGAEEAPAAAADKQYVTDPTRLPKPPPLLRSSTG